MWFIFHTSPHCKWSTHTSTYIWLDLHIAFPGCLFYVTVIMRMYINELDTDLAPNLSLSVKISLMHANTLALTHIHWSDLSTRLFTLSHTHRSLIFCCIHTLCSVAERSWVEMSEALSVTHTPMIKSLEVTMSLCCWFLEGVSTLHSVCTVCTPIGSPCSCA